jgi:ProP effector
MEQEKIANQKEALAFLSNKYPKCFFLDGPVKPLKIGIFQDIAGELADSEIVSKRLLRIILRHYTSSWRYLSAVKNGVARIDLLGVEGETVEQQHADHALEQLKESKAKAAKHRESKLKEGKKPPKHKGYENKQANDGKSHKKPDKAPSKSPKPSGSDKNKSPAKKVVKPVVHLPIQSSELIVGHSVLVKLGKEPMPVTITDIGKDGISVQLKSGMTVKVQSAQLYSLSKANNK